MDNSKFVRAVSSAAADYPDVTFSKKGCVYTCVNPYSYHMVRNNDSLYSEMDGLYVDGILMAKFISFLWGCKIPRLSFDMSGMAVDLFARLNGNDETIYFVGSKQEALEESIAHIRKAYPNMHIAGYRNGYFLLPEHREEEIRHIVEINPDFVIVGMGSPIQERFALDLKKAGFKGIVFTCGGFLHQTADGINYYPRWVNKYNLRAFYRLYKEKGLFKRLYNVLFEFPVLFTFDSIQTKLRKRSK